MAASPEANRRRTERRSHDITPVKQQGWIVKLPFPIFRFRWRAARFPFSLASMRRLSAILIALAPAAAAGASTAIIYAKGSWAALDRGALCEADSRSLKIAEKGKVQAIAGLTFTADRSRWGEFHARLSRVPRGGASVMLTVGDTPFLLVSSGDWAWSSGPAQEQAIIGAMRNASGMRVESRDSAGRRFSDPYVLDGAPTAIDAAAARCAGKMRPR